MAGLRKSKGRKSTVENQDSTAQPAAQNPPSRKLGRSTKTAEERHREEQQRLVQSVEQGHAQKVDQVEDDPATYERLYLAEITPNPNNARTRHISRKNPLENMLDPAHPDYEENAQVIEDIRIMGEHLKQTPLQVPISVYREGSRYVINEGHVRYYGMLVAYGENGQIDCKQYSVAPHDVAARRFRENSARTDLALKPKLMDFIAAEDALGAANKSSREASSLLGTSKTLLSTYRMARHTPRIWELIDNGHIKRLRTLNKLERKDIRHDPERLEKICTFLETEPNGESRLDDFLSGKHDGQVHVAGNKPGGTRGRPKSKARVECKDLDVARQLVRGELYERFEWTEEDFASFEAFQEKLGACMKAMMEEQKRGTA